MLLVCCLVRAMDRVLQHDVTLALDDGTKYLNQGAKSDNEEIFLIVSRGSPATIGRGGTTLPSWVDIRIILKIDICNLTLASISFDILAT